MNRKNLMSNLIIPIAGACALTGLIMLLFYFDTHYTIARVHAIRENAGEWSQYTIKSTNAKLIRQQYWNQHTILDVLIPDAVDDVQPIYHPE